jgi:hypothetical protein
LLIRLRVAGGAWARAVLSVFIFRSYHESNMRAT